MVRTAITVLLATLFLALASPTPAHALTADDVERIDISLDYYYYKSPVNIKIKIIKRDRHFYFCPYGEGEEVSGTEDCRIVISQSSIQDLISAASLPPFEDMDLHRLGIDQEGLNARAEEAFASKANGFLMQRFGYICDKTLCRGPAYKESFLKNYLNLEKAKQLFRENLGRVLTLVPPSLDIDISFNNGKKWSIYSRSGRWLMLPMTITTEDKKFETLAPEVSQALLFLFSHHQMLNEMREKAPAVYETFNYSIGNLLFLDPYEIWLEYLVAEPILMDIDILLLRRTLGKRMEFIETHFDIKEINIYWPRWWGRWIQKGTHPPVFLKYSIRDHNENMGVLFPMAKRVTEGVERLQALPWFVDWIHKESFLRLNINETHGHPKHLTLKQEFLILLQSQGYEAFGRKWLPRSKELILVTAVKSIKTLSGIKQIIDPLRHLKDPDQFSQWILLPNGDMILWNTSMDQVYPWNRDQHGSISNRKYSHENNVYYKDKYHYLVRVDPQRQMSFIKPDGH